MVMLLIKNVDDVAKSLTLEEALHRENGGYNILDGYINMNFNTIKNLRKPEEQYDAATKDYVDYIEKKVRENINKKSVYVIAAHGNYQCRLIVGEYKFKYGGRHDLSEGYKRYNLVHGFLMPYSGFVKKFVLTDLGLKISLKTQPDLNKFIEHINVEKYIDFRDAGKRVPIFTLDALRINDDIYRYDIFELGNVELKVIGRLDSEYINFQYEFTPVEDLGESRLNTGDMLSVRTTFNDVEFFKPLNLKEDFLFNYIATILIELDPL